MIVFAAEELITNHMLSLYTPGEIIAIVYFQHPPSPYLLPQENFGIWDHLKVSQIDWSLGRQTSEASMSDQMDVEKDR